LPADVAARVHFIDSLQPLQALLSTALFQHHAPL
jgi:hypothetical protein